MHKNWLIINLNKKYFLKAGNKVFRCQIGTEGLKNVAKKVEGDKTTPIGKWRLEKLYYRPDRILRPKPKKKNILKINQITKYCGWCDDIRSKYYNKYLNINNLTSPKTGFEKLWREDNAYDIVIQISHNINPTIKNKGSAIFVHCSFEDFRSTSGCIALEKRDLIFLIKNLKSDVFIRIK
jgi:L,D-peptidoglycan transpeptidase YkuD (ErfK/YbiS/YcfS/YnhG family)